MPTRSTKPLARLLYTRPSHGIRPEIVVTIYPTGELGFRELGRPSRTEQRLGVATLYEGAIRSAVNRSVRRTKELRREGMTLAQARRKARQENNL